jgi:hypothetical protein
LLKNGDAHTGERKFEGNGSADEPSSGDYGIEMFCHFRARPFSLPRGKANASE